LSETPIAAAGQVSADGQFRWDGQRWVPIPRGQREPTRWTRPMQLAAAALFVVEAVFTILTTAVYVNHDSMLRVLFKLRLDLPQGTNVDTAATAAVVSTWIVVIVIAAIEVIAALGSYLGWRWMFWAALVLLGVGAIVPIAFPDTAPIPRWVSAIESIAAFALFIWMLIGLIRFGPWAMKKSGT